MIDRLARQAEDIVKWDFQVEQQSFITRYGRAGKEFYKQVVLQSGAIPNLHPVKRIAEHSYDLAKRLAASDK